MKKLLALLLTFSLLLSLCACNPGSQGTGPQGNGFPGDNSQGTPLSGLTEVNFQAQYIRTNGYMDGANYPRVVIIRSVKELRDYYQENRDIFDLARRETVYSGTSIGFLDACDRYDAGYFEKQILIIVLLQEGSGSIRHKVTNVCTAEGGLLNIAIETITPEACTADLAQWHLLIEPAAGVDVNSALDVYLNGEAVRQTGSG